MKVRNILSTGLLTIGLVSTSLCYATALTIINNTDHDSSSIINGGKCSNSLPGGIGVTKAHSTNVVPDLIIGMACIGHSTDCKADVYMTDNCSGAKVGSVVFDTKKGIQSKSNESSTYVISGQGFTVQVDNKASSR